MRTRNRIRSVMAMTLAAVLLLPGMALADIVTNDVTSSTAGVLSVEAGSSAGVTYRVQNTNSNNSADPQNSCNPADGTSLTITPTGLPLGVTAPARTVTDCAVDSTITFSVASSVAAGDYAIGHALADSGAGTYQNQANFTLRVTAAPVTNTAPTIPGKPTASSPNAGTFDLTWAASQDGEGHAISYILERKNSAAGATFAAVTPAATSNSYSFTDHPEGTWTYRVKASDGSLSSAYSIESDPIKVDRSAPAQPEASTTPASANYTDAQGRMWFNGDVTVNWAAGADPALSDGTVGTGSTATPAAQIFDTDGPFTASAKSVDGVGNESAAASLLVGRDTTKPTSLAFVGAPSTVTLNGSFPTVTCSASDAGSGLASCVVTGQNTSSVGQKTLTATATDNVGNVSTITHTYSVGYKFVGFDRPVDNGGVLNKLKAGQAAPLKWRLLDANDLPITSLTSATVTVANYNCGLSTTVDLMEEVAAGGSGLQNLGDGYYQLNWKTPTTYANSCKTMNLNLGESTPRTALFQFTK